MGVPRTNIPATFGSLSTSRHARMLTKSGMLTGEDAIAPRLTSTSPHLVFDDDRDDIQTVINNVEMVLEYDYPRRRTNMGNDRVYTHGQPDILLPFICEGSTALAAWFENRAMFNDDTGELKAYVWRFHTEAHDGTEWDTSFRAKLENLSIAKNRGDQEEMTSIMGRLIILDAKPLSIAPSFLAIRATVNHDRNRVTVHFNRPVKASTWTAANISLSPSASETVVAPRDGSTVAEMTFSTPLTASTQYVITLNNIDSADELDLENGFRVMFRTPAE